MNKHEEARNLVNELVPTDAITPSQIDDLHIYITQQEKKEERAKKVDELLGLQRAWIDTTYSPYIRGKLWVKITKLEKELEELN